MLKMTRKQLYEMKDSVNNAANSQRADIYGGRSSEQMPYTINEPVAWARDRYGWSYWLCIWTPSHYEIDDDDPEMYVKMNAIQAELAREVQP